MATGSSSPAPELFPADADGLVGSIAIWLSDTLPSPKWDWADGGELSREGHSLLFSRTGEDWGDGDGTTTFNKPNLEGMFLVGKDSSDVDFDELGDTGGSKAATMPTHGHAHTLDVSASNVLISESITIASVTDDGANQVNVTDHYTFGSANPTITGSVSSASGSGDNCPPFKVVNYIIKIL